MPVLTSSTSSPSRRLGGSYTSYSSSYGGSSYSRSSSTFSSSSNTAGRTSSLDRSPYSSSYVTSSYKYTSPSSVSVSTRDYSVSSRPPISTRTTTSSLYSSSTRTSPARSYFSTRKSTSEDGVTGSSSRSRETQSETRDMSNSNNNYLNGNVRRSRDYSSNLPPSTSSTLSKYRTDRASLTNGSSAAQIRSKYSTEREEVPKISERIRNFQASKSVVEVPFKSRFLRSSLTSQQQPETSKTERSTDENAPEEIRPSVSDLRRRYDQNRNHVTPERSRTPGAVSTGNVSIKPPSGSKSSRTTTGNTGYGSDSDESVERDGRSTPVNQRLASITPTSRLQNSPTPDRITVNGSDRASPARPSVPKEIVPRSSSPSTLSSSSSDGDNQDSVQLATARQSVNSNKSTGGRGTRQSISDSVDQLSETSSPKLAPRSRTCSSSQTKTTSNENAGLVGLRNIGNTCFMNSVLQCLSNTRPVLEYVISNDYASHINTSTSSMNGALIKAFAIVLAELWKRDEDEDDSYSSSAVNPTALKSQIQKFAPRFMGYNQQDAQEFLRYLLEGLHEDVNRIAVKPRPLEHDISDNLSDSEKAMESWKRYLRRDDSKIVDLFVGQLKSTLQCTVCGHCSVTFDPFWDLSLPIPPSSKSIVSNVKLHHCLDLFAKEEILDGDEKPTCSKCQARRKCTKKFTIHKFPQILVLHLKRFSPGERFRKLDASVDFPLTDLDMSAYTSPGIKPSPCSYQLYGVINHSGSAYSGHYTASCRHPFSATWHEYNDSRVSNLSAQRVISSEAYLLFYELESHEARL